MLRALLWKIFLFALATSSGYKAANAQQFYEYGTLITTSQDTLRGYIKTTSYEQMSERVQFRSDPLRGKPTSYLASDLQEVFVNRGNQRYEQFRVTVTKDLPTGEQIRVPGLRLLRHVISGNVDLFILNDKSNEIMYLRSTSKELLPLRIILNQYDRRLRSESPQIIKSDTLGTHQSNLTTGYFQEYPEYLGVLRRTLTDCRLEQLNNDLRLNRQSIRNLVLDYNRCGTDYPSVKRYFTRNLVITPSIYFSYPNVQLRQFDGAGVGLQVEAGNPSFNENLTFGIGVNLYTGRGLVPEELGGEPVLETDLSFKEWFFRINQSIAFNGQLSGMVHFGIAHSDLTYFEEVFLDGQSFQIETRRQFALLFGGGLNYFFKKNNFLRLEVGAPHWPNVRFGYGRVF